MPNFDTGHYFLTTLAPIKHGSTHDELGAEVSHIERLRTTLAILPTALQSPATEQIGFNSPFARNRRTHLCRFMVLDDVVYNGRLRSDAIVNALTGSDPLVPQKVDKLNCAYLMFVADFDAVREEGDPLPDSLSPAEQDAVRDGYARRLWQTMGTELREIYDNCVGFDDVSDADGFARYLSRCQVETTMPFNDYWIHPPKLHPLPLTGLIALVGLPALVTLIALLWCLFGAESLPLVGWSPGWTFLGGLLATGLAAWAAYAYTLWNGNRPMSPGVYGDLPSVLKSLYLQQHFADFAVESQGKDPAALHADFGAFLARHKPEDKMAPSQRPGVISIAREESVIES